MAEIRYFQHEGVAGDYFDCPSNMGSLSVLSCAANYNLAMSPQGLKEGRRVTCRACPVGASHAGVPVGCGSVSRFVGSGLCARCQKDSTRLIRGSICVGCYNREREVLIGRNAKGGVPSKCRAVFALTLACIMSEGQRVEIRRFDRVSSLLEAKISMLRTEAKSCVFGWISAPRVRLCN
jgi:hypothetical protein